MLPECFRNATICVGTNTRCCPWAQRSKLSNAARFGRNLASARTDSGRTQEEVAELLGVTTETIGRMERGITWPSLPVCCYSRSLQCTGEFAVPAQLRMSKTPMRMESQLARLSEDDRVWVQANVRELCDRLATASGDARATCKETARQPITARTLSMDLPTLPFAVNRLLSSGSRLGFGSGAFNMSIVTPLRSALIAHVTT
ncbi:helix-turn-helix domain-containing protein [Ralstonia solanacearum]|uniref:helix-turn-helix transcriptional regulator n=1 Tax=Ralstonia solanacearum TaxID=305 RepID=UPI0018D0A9CC